MCRSVAMSLICLSCLLSGCSNTASVSDIRPVEGSPPEQLASIEVPAGAWPWWRGPERTNIASSSTPPTHWSESENVLWKVQVPGRGHASPVVWENQVFVASADEQQEVQMLICYNLQDGKEQWSKPLHRGALMRVHQKNTHASATPACDGERVFTAFINHDALWVTATSRDGKILWQQQAGPFTSEHGYGSSPVVYGSLVIVAADSGGASYTAALHRKTGKIVWRTGREGGIERSGGGSYGTPIVAHVAGRPQLLLSGRSKVTSYDPENGEMLWTCEGPAETTANTIAWSGDLVFAGAGFPEQGVIAIRADGSGDVTDSHVVWHVTNLQSYVPSPLAVGDRLLIARDNGVATCVEAASGDEIWTKRLGGNFSASPAMAGPYVYLPNERGTVYVFKLQDQFEAVAENDLGDGGFASPVFSGDKLLLRTDQYLYCIGE